MAKRAHSTNGDCYESAAKFMMGFEVGLSSDADRYLLVHAEVAGQGPLEGMTYGHAFVLDTKTDTVIDKSNGRDLKLPKLLYYTLGHISYIDNIYEYTTSEVRENLLETMHYGPWDLETSSGY